MSTPLIESRGFLIVDALSPGCLTWTQKSLVHLGHLLALAVKKPPPIGLAVLQRKGPKQSTQLQVLLRPGTSFQLREYLACIRRVTAANPSDAADGRTLSMSVKALIEHMITLPGGDTCRNHVFIISSKFSANPMLQKVIQVCCLQLNASLHFLELAGPEVAAGLQAGPAAPAAAAAAVQQLQPDVVGPDVAFEQCIRGFAPFATFDSFTADCDAVVDLLCHSWLRVLMASSSTASSQPDLLLQLGQQALACSLQQHILQLDPWLLPAHLCPCHSLPMQPPTGSAAAAAVTAGMAAASDASTAAGLLLVPEEVPWRCVITGQPVPQGLSSCHTDPSVMQLSRHTQLRAGPSNTAAAGACAGNGSSATGVAASGGCVGLAGNLPVALALPPGQPCQLEVKHVVGLSQIDSMMLYGMPLVATPACRPSSSIAAAAVGLLARGQQQQQQGGTGGEGGDEGDAAMLMRSVCQLLLEEQQVLLAASSHDVVRRLQQPLQQWYLLQPAADGCSLLLRYMASKEQLLPPKGFRGLVAVEDDVVLLDAEQLEAVRGSLAGLGLGSSSSCSAGLGQGLVGSEGQQQQQQGLIGSSDSGGAGGGLRMISSGGNGDAGGLGVHGDGQGGGANGTSSDMRGAATTAEHENEAATAAATAVPVGLGCGSGEGLIGSPCMDGLSGGPSSSMPLLSCGLHDWVASVLDSSSGTYTAPALPLVPPQRPVGVLPHAAVAAPPPGAAGGAGLGLANGPAWQQQGEQQQQAWQQHQQGPAHTGQQQQDQQFTHPVPQHIMPNGPAAAAGHNAAATGPGAPAGVGNILAGPVLNRRRGLGQAAAAGGAGGQAGGPGGAVQGVQLSGAGGAGGASGGGGRQGAGRNALRLSSSNGSGRRGAG